MPDIYGWRENIASLVFGCIPSLSTDANFCSLMSCGGDDGLPGTGSDSSTWPVYLEVIWSCCRWSAHLPTTLEVHKISMPTSRRASVGSLILAETVGAALKAPVGKQSLGDIWIEEEKKCLSKEACWSDQMTELRKRKRKVKALQWGIEEQNWTE